MSALRTVGGANVFEGVILIKTKSIKENNDENITDEENRHMFD